MLAEAKALAAAVGDGVGSPDTRGHGSVWAKTAAAKVLEAAHAAGAPS